MSQVTGLYPDTLPVLLRPKHVPVRQYGPVTSRRVEQEPRPSRLAELRVGWEMPDPPEWAQTPPEPKAYLKAGWKKINDGVNDGTDRALLAAVGFAAWYAITYRPWIPDLVVVGLWLGALTYGLGTVWLCEAGMRPNRWTTRRAAVATALLGIIGIMWLANGALVWLALLSLLVAQAFAARPVRLEAPNWWSDQRLIRNWSDAGLFGARPPEDLWFRRIAPFHEDEHGMQTLTVVPMAGPRKDARVVNIGTDAVAKASPALERVMGLKIGQLHVSHDPDHDAGAITLTVTPVVAKRGIVKGVVPERWDYNQPLFIGNDPLGRPVYRRTWGTHSGFVAMTQKGKTAAVLWDLAHAAVDPSIPMYLLDYKGDEKDWRALHPLCKRVISGASLDNARRTLGVLEEIERLSESRSEIDPDRVGVVVVVDEWFRLLSLAQRLDSELAKQLDSLLTELMATAASRRIKFISLFQGGTADYINKPMRINIGQRFCGVTEKTDEMRYFLETMPPKNHMPKAAGQFVFKDDGVPPTLVTHPYLDPTGFAEACRRGLALRSATPVEKTVDPLEAAVLSLLEVDEPQKASELLSMLPTELRPAGKDEAAQAQALGYRLGKMSGVESVAIRGRKHYRRSPVTAPSQPRPTAANRPSTGVLEGDPSMQESASVDAGVSP